MVLALMRRLYGSDDLFPDDRMNAYHPHQSVNYVASHDGFTLYDLVAYNQKRNWHNGHGNMDGVAENYSWNCGWEGDDGAPLEVVKLRKQQIKNFCCLLFLSNGTPMFRSGDEFMHTQAGNNNPYNQDNEAAWIDWSRLHANPDKFRFFKLMIAFRKAHPSLARMPVLARGCPLVRGGTRYRPCIRFPQPRLCPARRIATGHLRDDQCLLGGADFSDTCPVGDAGQYPKIGDGLLAKAHRSQACPFSCFCDDETAAHG